MISNSRAMINTGKSREAWPILQRSQHLFKIITLYVVDKQNFNLMKVKVEQERLKLENQQRIALWPPVSSAIRRGGKEEIRWEFLGDVRDRGSLGLVNWAAVQIGLALTSCSLSAAEARQDEFVRQAGAFTLQARRADSEKLPVVWGEAQENPQKGGSLAPTQVGREKSEDLTEQTGDLFQYPCAHIRAKNRQTGALSGWLRNRQPDPRPLPPKIRQHQETGPEPANPPLPLQKRQRHGGIPKEEDIRGRLHPGIAWTQTHLLKAYPQV